MSQIFDFWDRFSGQVGNTALCLKNTSKNERPLRLVASIFTKLSQNLLSNQYTHFDILTCQMLWQVMEGLLNLFRFLGIFIHYYWPFMSKLLYLHQTFPDCVFNQYRCVKMSDVTASYGMPFNFITFSYEFST